MQGRKITLADAAESGAEGLLIACMNHLVGHGGCWHSARFDLGIAIGLWGDGRRLDELPFRCGRCGSRNVDVRGEYRYPPASATGGVVGPTVAELVDQWREANPKLRAKN